MSTIVVGTDGSDAARAALVVAAELAAARGDELHVVSVFAPLRGSFASVSPPWIGVDLIEAEREAVQEALEGTRALASERGFGMRGELRTGDPADQLCAAAREQHAPDRRRGARVGAGAQRAHGQRQGGRAQPRALPRGRGAPRVRRPRGGRAAGAHGRRGIARPARARA
jgi:nucleotide-binding universal stress UspA family protein